MSNEIEEVIDTPVIEETQNEAVETDNTPTVEDYQKLQKELKTALAQKEHFKTKAQKVALEEASNKQTATTAALTREEAILFAKGYTEEEVDLATKISKINGVGLLVAIEDDYVKNKIDSRVAKERSAKASLSPSSGSTHIKTDKPVGQMTRAEHEAYYKKVIGSLYSGS